MNYIVTKTEEVRATYRYQLVFDQWLVDQVNYCIESEIASYLPNKVELDDLIAVWEESGAVWEKTTDFGERYKKLKDIVVSTYSEDEVNLADFIYESIEACLLDPMNATCIASDTVDSEWDVYWD